MPGRKLNAEQVEELRLGDVELMKNKVITRPDGNGGEVTITKIAELAAWKGIKAARYHELKRNGWKLKRGLPVPMVEDGQVPLSAYNLLMKSLKELIVDYEHQLTELRQQLKEKS